MKRDLSAMENLDGMTLERLEAILDAYGAEPARWPQAERGAAEDLLARSVDARALASEARQLDMLLNAAPLHEPSEALVARLIAARPAAMPVPVPVIATSAFGARKSLMAKFFSIVWPYGSPAFPAGAVLASLVLGVITGVSAGSLVLWQRSPVTSVAAGNSSTSKPGEQIVSLALAHTSYPEEWTQ